MAREKQSCWAIKDESRIKAEEKRVYDAFKPTCKGYKFKFKS